MRLSRPVREFVEALRASGGSERAVKEKAYLKSELEHYGVPVPEIRRATKAFAKQHPLDHAALVRCVDELWSTQIHEARTAAVELLHHHLAELSPNDLPLIERLLRQCKTWALLDHLSVNTLGKLVGRHPALMGELDRFAADDDFWIRRAAMLALLGELRRGDGDWPRFCRYADQMLDEREFFIRKAIGWILRERSKKCPDEVFAWIAPRTHRASGVTMREAAKKLPAEQQDALMQAYRAKTPCQI
jgi:3-methyladenine DNA glycosylase AlkD